MAVAPGDPALWIAERGDSRIHFFGGRRPLPMPWSAPRVEAVLAAAEELWTETPPVTPETQALAFHHGVDSNAPLEAWLTVDDQARVEHAAAEAGVAAKVLEPFRPWLAAQVLLMASEARRGLDHESSPETVIRSRAEQVGITIRSEFPTARDLVEFFSALPKQAEVELLRVTLDDLQDPARDERRAEAWLYGDLRLEEAHSAEIQRRHPAFYQHIGIARNEAWVDRVDDLLNAGKRALIVVGIGHVTGPGNVTEQLASAGIHIQRV